ncbi:MAG: DUF362 domain-containing protein [Thermodesulfobacteriota bacterium]|nr:DUF362 domain-containing protein [Thermodesulfobacteriota bacterium]
MEKRRTFLKKILGFFVLGWKAGRLPLIYSPFSLLYPVKTGSCKSYDISSRVVLVKSSDLQNDGRINAFKLSKMLDSGMLKFTGASDIKAAWSKLFSPYDIVGIKVNTLAKKGTISHPSLINLICKNLISIGIREENIIIWDRTTKELYQAGFHINYDGKGIRCFGNDAKGYGYDMYPQEFGRVGTRYSKILKKVTALINVPVLKDHGLCAVSLSLKNYYGAIVNPNKYHNNNCNPYIADVSLNPDIKEKQRLIILDAIYAQYHGGPSYKPMWKVDYNGLIIGNDPVAIDYIGLGEIDKLRKLGGKKTFTEEGRFPEYLVTAGDSEHRLGVGSSENIEFTRLIV